MADFLTITENYLKENGLINENTEAKVITPIIKLVQKMYLHPILGTALFTEIKDQIIAENVSTANQTLLDDYILDVMLWYCHHEAPAALKYRLMNKGVMVKNSENSAAADLAEIKFIMDRWKNNAEYIAERLTKFLQAHTDDYPKYLENTDCDQIKPNKSNYTSSLFLDDCL